MKTRYYAIGAILVLIAAAAFAYLWPEMPERVPVHWNARGEVDGYGTRWTLFVLGPGLMAATMLLFAVMPWLSPKRFEVDTSMRTYLHLMLITVGMTGYFYAVVLWVAIKGSVAMDVAIPGGICVLIVLIGNLLGKVRRNFFIGIRTPWTLASERVWYETHRLGAKLMVGAGLIGIALLAAGLPSWLSIVAITVGSLAPVLHSLILYKRLQKKGELDVPA